MLSFMPPNNSTPDALEWFKSTSSQKVNVTRIGEALGVSRNTARSRLDDGLSADDIIVLARAFSVNPARALQELEKLTIDEVFEFMDADGTLLSTATAEQLIYQLAEESLPLSDRISLGAAAKALADQSNTFTRRRAEQLQSEQWTGGIPEDAVADSSPEEGGYPDDFEP